MIIKRDKYYTRKSRPKSMFEIIYVSSVSELDAIFFYYIIDMKKEWRTNISHFHTLYEDIDSDVVDMIRIMNA